MLFLFTDNQITDERFLVYLNDLLSSANIPDLYTQDEKDNIANMVLGKVKAAGLSQDPKSCWDYFISQVRHNLHVALCFSPVGPDFRIRARKFPALVNSTVIDWFQPWPEDALATVGQRFIATVEFNTPVIRTAVEKFMPMSFNTAQVLHPCHAGRAEAKDGASPRPGEQLDDCESTKVPVVLTRSPT